MAIFGFDVKPISRGNDGSLAKAVSYICRENVYDPYFGVMHYSSHSKDCIYKAILLPDNAPQSFRDLNVLLEANDNAEKRYDARTGRVVRLSLPNDKEFSDNERVALVEEFVKENFISKGLCAIVAIHEGANDDPSKNNPHAHVVVTDRPVGENGFLPTKDRTLNQRERLLEWRKSWADIHNKAFKEKGLKVRVSHESLEIQGIDREPTRPLGRAATALERKGVRTVRGDENREIEARNKKRERNRRRDRSR